MHESAAYAEYYTETDTGIDADTDTKLKIIIIDDNNMDVCVFVSDC